MRGLFLFFSSFFGRLKILSTLNEALLFVLKLCESWMVHSGGWATDSTTSALENLVQKSQKQRETHFVFFIDVLTILFFSFYKTWWKRSQLHEQYRHRMWREWCAQSNKFKCTPQKQSPSSQCDIYITETFLHLSHNTLISNLSS